MKNNNVILAILLICCALPVFAQNSTWQKFSAKEKEFESISREVPIILKSVPASADACDVTGTFIGGNIFELNGEAWPEGDAVRLKVKGRASNGVKVMLYGTVTYVSEETVLYKFTFSADANGQGVEQPMSCYLTDKTAEAERKAKEREREAQERELEEARRKETPEYKIEAILEDLIAAKRVGVVEKKKVNWGSALLSAANADVSGVESSIGTSKVIDVIAADGESKSGTIAFDPKMSLTLTLKDKSTVKATFDATCSFELKNPQAYAFALYSEDMTDVLYFFEVSGTNRTFLLSDGKVYKLDKNTVKQIKSVMAG